MASMTLLSGNGKRGILDTSVDDINPNFVLGDNVTLLIETQGTEGSDILLLLDLTGIPKGVIISAADLILNVIIAADAGTSAELEVEIVRLPYGLSYDIWTLTGNTYDGVNPWPDDKYDRSIRILGAMPTSTGSWAVGDIKELINDSLERGENYLYLVISRVQRGADHRSLICSSSEALDDSLRPSLNITHSDSIAPATIIRGNRLTVKSPIKHIPKEHRREGGYDLSGQQLIINTDGSTHISSSGDDIVITHNDVQTMKIVSTGLDGYGTKRLTNWAGRRGTFCFGWNTTNTGALRILYTSGLAVTAIRRGYLMPRAGSIVKITMIVDINAYAGTEINCQLWKNNVLLTNCKAVVDTPIVANGQKAIASFAVGTYTFDAEDDLMLARTIIGGLATTDDIGAMLEVEYEN